MMKAIIVDDEMRARRIFRTLLEQNHPEVKIVGEAENVPEAVQLINSKKPNIVFTDIEMPEYSGFELLKFIGDIDFALVFVTSYQEYAIRAFEVSAVDYLLKPIDEKALAKAISKIESYLKGSALHDSSYQEKELSLKMETLKENLSHEYINRLALPHSEGLVFVETEEIMYLIAEGSYTKIVLADNSSILATKKIKYFEEHLNHPCFFRSHRSYLINLNRVSQYIRTGNYIMMDDGFKANLARERKTEFLRRFNA